MHIALAGYAVNAVKLLRFGHNAESGDGEHLGLTAGEHTGTVHSGKQTDFRRKRTNLVKSASVNALAFVNKPAANNIFLKLIDSFVNFKNVIGINLVEFFVNRGDDGLQSGVANVFIVGIKGLFDVLDGKIFNCVEKLLGNFDFLILKLRLADFGNDGVYEVYHFDVLFVGSHNCLEHGFVIHFICSGFNHNNLFIGRAYDKVQVGFCFLLRGGVKDDFAVHKGNLAAGNGAVPRNVGNGDSHRSAEHSADYIGVIRINRKRGHYYGAVVAHILGEKRTHGAVNNAAVKNGAVSGAAFSSWEGTGYFANGIELFVKINGKREVVYALSWGFACGNVAENSCFTVSYKYGSIGKSAHLAGFKTNFSSGKFGFKNSVIFEQKNSSVSFCTQQNESGSGNKQ